MYINKTAWRAMRAHVHNTLLYILILLCILTLACVFNYNLSTSNVVFYYDRYRVEECVDDAVTGR